MVAVLLRNQARDQLGGEAAGEVAGGKGAALEQRCVLVLGDRMVELDREGAEAQQDKCRRGDLPGPAPERPPQPRERFASGSEPSGEYEQHQKSRGRNVLRAQV